MGPYSVNLSTFFSWTCCDLPFCIDFWSIFEHFRGWLTCLKYGIYRQNLSFQGFGARHQKLSLRGLILRSFWSPEAHNMPPRGALMPILGISEPPISDVTFLMNFGSRQGLPGGANRLGRSTSPAVCFSTFWLITVISPCVFDVFRITGFRYRWRERFPLEIYLSQRESRRSIPAVEHHTPRVPEARWRI